MFEIILAFFAGILSFLSPCVLPLVPAYISYMAGRVTHTVAAQVQVGVGGTATASQTTSRMAMGVHGVAFVAGFTVVFVLLTVIASAFAATVEDILLRVGGLLIVLFGLHFMGVIPMIFAWLRKHAAIMDNILFTLGVGLAVSAAWVWGFAGTLDPSALDMGSWATMIGLFLVALTGLTLFLGDAFTAPGRFWHKALNTIDVLFYADTRQEMTAEGNKGLWGSFVMGIVFSAGWTPCIGPVLGAAISLSLQNGGMLTAAVRITAFSLGLGIPFILTALMFDSAQGQLRKLNRHLEKIKLVTGALLIFIGTMLLTGQMRVISSSLNDSFGEFSYQMEECLDASFRGNIAWGDFFTCAGDRVPLELLKYEHTSVLPSYAVIRELLARYPDFTFTDYLTQEQIDAAIAAAPNYNADNAEGAVEVPDEPLELTPAPTEEAASDEAESALRVGHAIGNIAPDFSLPSLDGATVSLADFRGKTVLVNFWYVGCPPCEYEMPDLQSAYETYRGNDAVILAVNRQDSILRVGGFAEQFGLSFPVLLDYDASVQDAYGIDGYPTSFLIDENGIIVDIHHSILTPDDLAAWLGD